MKTRVAMMAAGLGAGLMYLLDPQAGRRRRASMRDTALRALTDARGAMRPAVEDLYNRVYGTVAETRSRLGSTQDDPTDTLLVDRVRSEIGSATSRPRAVEVTASEGRVVLAGDVLASDEQRVLRAARAARGVVEVENRMRVHTEPDAVRALQGSGARSGRSGVRGTWPPAYRLAAAAGGGLLTLLGARRRGVAGFLLSSFGTSMVARGVTNVHLRRLMGVGAPEPAIDVHKTIYIGAPVERVFSLWSDFENFPRFMRNVREVRDLGHGRSEWTVAGPAGVPVSWAAVISDYIPNELLAWRTERGAAVHHAGVVRFEREGDGTRVTVRLSYHPAGGAIGHGVATLFGADPKSEMDRDMARMKTFIETGALPRDAAQSSGHVAAATASPPSASGHASGVEQPSTRPDAPQSQTGSEPSSAGEDSDAGPDHDRARWIH